MSNYPPGVTGFEPEIAGYDERDNRRTVTCSHDDTPHYVEGDEFEGDVAGTEYIVPCYAIVFEWTCPVCGADKETDFPDDSRWDGVDI